MKQSETNNTATLLDDGRVLLAGGVASIYCNAGCTDGWAGRGEQTKAIPLRRADAMTACGSLMSIYDKQRRSRRAARAVRLCTVRNLVAGSCLQYEPPSITQLSEKLPTENEQDVPR
jgi:hypothetical protein